MLLPTMATNGVMFNIVDTRYAGEGDRSAILSRKKLYLNHDLAIVFSFSLTSVILTCTMLWLCPFRLCRIRRVIKVA